MIDSKAVKNWLLGLQQNIVYMLEVNEDDAKFKADEWTKPTGEGITCILEGGQLLERGGVGFSHVTGNQLPPSATSARPHLIGRKWEAMGMSLVFHPLNPYVPTVHLNVRFFVAQATNNEPATWWFGGGMDLTPYYGFDDDAEHFHRTCSDALRPYGEDVYTNYKKACDEYFYLKHRNEPRGIGGIFFDDLDTPDFETAFALTRAVGDNFLTAWLPIAQRRRDLEYGPEQRAWQAYRRGRYVEFNLVWDRGTLFGLQSGGRTESILMSMPPNVTWSYDYRPEPNTPEATLYERYLKPKDWI